MLYEVITLVEKVVERNRLVEENRSLKAEIRRRFDPDQVIFRSAAFRRVFELAKKVAPSDAGKDVTGQVFAVRSNEIFLMGQSRPLRSMHRGEGWTSYNFV